MSALLDSQQYRCCILYASAPRQWTLPVRQGAPALQRPRGTTPLTVQHEGTSVALPGWRSHNSPHLSHLVGGDAVLCAAIDSQAPSSKTLPWQVRRYLYRTCITMHALELVRIHARPLIQRVAGDASLCQRVAVFKCFALLRLLC
jgi:hypothetical protein